MKAVDVFVDTNILLYAHDLDAGEKHVKALNLIQCLWTERKVPSLSIQVLQEMHVNLVRKGVPLPDSIEIVGRYLAWRVVTNSEAVLRRAFTVQQRWGLSFWDASIVAAALQTGAVELWTEDLNTGQDYGGVVAVNPLEC